MAWLVYRSIDEGGNCYEPKTEHFSSVEDARAAQRILQYAGENSEDLLQSEVVDSAVPDIQRVIDNWYAEDRETLEKSKEQVRKMSELSKKSVERWKAVDPQRVEQFKDTVMRRWMDEYQEINALRNKLDLPGFTMCMVQGHQNPEMNGVTLTWLPFYEKDNDDDESENGEE